MPPGTSSPISIFALGWEHIGQPAVVAALVAGAVALLVMIGNAIINWILHRSKLKFDRQLARERFEFEKALAERKVALDQALHGWKRNSEFAEQALSAFYEARSRIQAIRSPGSFNSENSDRVGRDLEPENVRSTRDTYYPYFGRVRDQANFFNEFYAKRYRAIALFGADSDVAFRDIWTLLVRVKVAAETLATEAGQPAHHQRQLERHQRLEELIWEGAADPDPIAPQLDAAVESAGRIFRPAIVNLPDVGARA